MAANPDSTVRAKQLDASTPYSIFWAGSGQGIDLTEESEIPSSMCYSRSMARMAASTPSKAHFASLIAMDESLDILKDQLPVLQVL